MKYIVKFAGMVLIFAGVSFLGFFKSFAKRDYIKRLKKISSALQRADNMLRTGVLSRERIITSAFSEVENLKFATTGTAITDKEMSGELKHLINGFFCDFGSSDIISERERIKSLKKELSAEISHEEAEYNTSGRLWRTAGVCAGLALCIMLV